MTPEEFNALPESIKVYLKATSPATIPTTPTATPTAPPAPVATPPAPPPAPPATTVLAGQSTPPAPPGMPDLDGVPDQAAKRPEFLPWDREYDVEVTLDQIQNRCGERSGPHFYAVFTIVKASPQSLTSGIVEGTQRALIWKYNPHAYGAEADKSRRSLGRFRTFIRQACGLPEGSPGITERATELLEASKESPSLGIPLRILSIRGNEQQKRPGTYFYNQTVIAL